MPRLSNCETTVAVATAVSSGTIRSKSSVISTRISVEVKGAREAPANSAAAPTIAYAPASAVRPGNSSWATDP